MRARHILPFILVFAAVSFAPPRQGFARELLIAIDIGHSPVSMGTPSARNRPEYEYNRKMSLALVREMNRSPRLRAFPVNIEGQDITLSRRAEIINEAKPDLIISIHHDSVRPALLSDWTYKGKPAQYCDKYRGYSIFISRRNGHPKASRLVALALGSEMRKAGFLPSNHHAEAAEGERRQPVDTEKGVYFYDGLVVLKETKAPALLLECGIIRNRGEERLLRNRFYRSRIARTVRAAVESQAKSPQARRGQQAEKPAR
ncbi:MAG: N-acetylmuramoyl-L-alanine amidase [Syntrophobacter sp.]